MKGQLMPIIFAIFVAVLVFIGYIFFNIFYGIRYEEEVFQLKIMDVIRNLIEQFKNYLQLSLIFSTEQALKEHATGGGLVSAAPWICNRNQPVEPEASRKCLENYTEYYITFYTNFFNTTLPVRLTYTNFEECIIDVGDIFSGKYDEGNFAANCSTITIMVSSKNVQQFENINISHLITKNRYWYLFRKFYEWASGDSFHICICGKLGCSCRTSFSEEEDCRDLCKRHVEECAQVSFENLKRKFDGDEFIKCKKQLICCQQGKGPPCQPPTDCMSWSNRCMADCKHQCTPPGHFSTKELTTAYTSPHITNYKTLLQPNYLSRLQFSFSSPLNCCYEYWYEGRLSAGYTFECTDYKYFVSSGKGPVPLSFRVRAYAFWNDTDVCKYKGRCDCPSDATSCGDCTPTGPSCTSCFPC